MPCMSGPSCDDDPCSGIKGRLTKTEDKLKEYTRAFCEVTSFIEKHDAKAFKKFLDENGHIKRLYIEHGEEDEVRWYAHYSKEYSEFTKREIVKMVRAGILERV